MRCGLSARGGPRITHVAALAKGCAEVRRGEMLIMERWIWSSGVAPLEKEVRSRDAPGGFRGAW